MSRPLVLTPAAESDLADAFRWYEHCLPGLGQDFLKAVDSVFNHIRANPEAFPVVHRQFRRALTPRFPFGIFYLIERNRIVVMAVFHTSRNPQTWKRRTPN